MADTPDDKRDATPSDDKPWGLNPIIGQLRMHAGASDTRIPRPLLERAAITIRVLETELAEVKDDLKTALANHSADLSSPSATLPKLPPEANELAAMVRENARMRKALDAIYNHNEAARAAVIQHYGLWHATPDGGKS